MHLKLIVIILLMVVLVLDLVMCSKITYKTLDNFKISINKGSVKKIINNSNRTPSLKRKQMHHNTLIQLLFIQVIHPFYKKEGTQREIPR